jgi:hypothetical protein
LWQFRKNLSFVNKDSYNILINLTLRSTMKKLAFALIVFLSSGLPSGYLYAEEQPAIDEEWLTTTSADFQENLFTNYFSIGLDLGLDFLWNAPNKMEPYFLNPKLPTMSIYYNIPITNSHFMFSPGILWGNHSYSFKNNYTLTRQGEHGNRHTTIIEAKSLLDPQVQVKSSSLDISYIDLVAELRFNTNRLEPQDGFFIAVGGNLGVLLNAATTLQYQEDNQLKARITKESFNLNSIRYGTLVRVGWGRFGAFYAQTLSNLFNKQGFYKHTMKPFSVGLTINLL